MGQRKISNDLLRQLKDTINIVDVVGQHVVLRKSGANFMGLCPFHAERSPSFSVSENKKLYHCYGCKRGGDLVTFVMEILGVSFPEAIEDLAERAQVPLPSDWQGASSTGGSPEAEQHHRAQRAKQALAYKLNRFAAAYFHQTVNYHQLAQDYFRLRGTSQEWVRSFYLGSALGIWDGLTQHLISKKAPLDLAVELGLVRPSARQSRKNSDVGYFDLFRNRVIFPIVNMRGQVAGFGGRILDSEEQPKYLNSPDSILFQKSKLAFGLFQAQKHIREKDEVIVVEGYFDALAMHAAGFCHVVATCGTALTTEHLKLFRRFTDRIVLLFDGDHAGRQATLRAMELGLEQGAILFGAQMGQGLDPDEMVLQSKGSEQMSALLQGAKPLLDDAIEEAIQTSHRSPEDRVQALKKVAGWLGRFRDPVGREVRLQLLQKKLGVSRGLIHEALNQGGLTLKAEKIDKIQVSSVIKVHSPVFSLSQTEQILLGGLIYAYVQPQNLGKVTPSQDFLAQDFLAAFSDAKESLPPGMALEDLFMQPHMRDLVAQILKGPGFLERLRKNPDSLFDGDTPQRIQSFLTEVLLWLEPPFSLIDFKGAILKNVAKLWARFSQRIKESLAEAELNKDIGLQAQLMKDYLDVQRKMKDFNSFYDQE